VERFQVDEFLRSHAPQDVQDTISWLVAEGYPLVSHQGESTFGAQFVYARDVEVHITVDRSQWYLDIAPRLGAEAWQYDLLLAAHDAQEYGVLFPQTGSRSLQDPLPVQLPEGVSWRETLPDILSWVSDEARAPVERALRHRHNLMWPRK
jgi:hypothetical protein